MVTETDHLARNRKCILTHSVHVGYAYVIGLLVPESVAHLVGGRVHGIKAAGLTV